MHYANAIAVGVLMVVGAGGQAFARLVQFEDLSAIARDIGQFDVVAETRLYCMALAVFFEGGSTAESEDGQRHIARVVHERAKADQWKWGGSDICDVVFLKRKDVCQLSFACLPAARRTPRAVPAWHYSMTIAQDELEERSALPERSIRYYMNSSLTSARNACRFRKEFVKVVEAGRHEFFREPTDEERAEFGRGEFSECNLYAQQLSANKYAGHRKSAKQKRLVSLVKKRLNKVKFAKR